MTYWAAWSDPPASQKVPGPAVSVGVPTVLPGLDEALYREAEERKHRQQLREQEAWWKAQQQSQPKLGRTSKALCHSRLERELRAAFHKCAGHCFMEMPGHNRMLAISRARVGDVLEAMDFLCARDEVLFCEKLGLLLDREDTGMVSFGKLLDFLLTALDTVGHLPDRPSPSLTPCSLEDECFNQLEWQLLREFMKMISTRHSRATTQSLHRRSGSCGRMYNVENEHAGLSHHGMLQEGSRAKPMSPRKPLSARDSRGEKLVSRCHLLYHQAIFAAREGAQLEDEIKQLKEMEEMRECTFKPQLTSFRPPSWRPQVRNFDATVARMKNAHKQHQERKEQSNRIPSGENYERLRRLGMQPFSCAFRDQRHRPQPLVYVDVKVGSKTGRISVHEQDDVYVLSKNFAKTFQLDKSAQERLAHMLRQAKEQVQRADVD
mmetsp:Transcript_67903/g.150523  ORF Transcript_67903/g.150523 Transcript_67903/m.150523 type:complete len:434 (-) Transcript_67903:154-1455(-)